MATVSKAEPIDDGTSSSIGSTPEPDGELYPQENAQVQKRKGGRKPIYATSEERKQRNRQAQAAFRERRTEYIKQLETTIKHHEDALQSLQQSHRSAADECLMLRYKNSLLERILLEKGIDVQAELRAKTGSPHLAPTAAPTSQPTQQPPIQRAIINRRHQARRSASSITPKIETNNAAPQSSRESVLQSGSPQLQPTPPSQTSSPSTSSKSTGFVTQSVMTPPAPDVLAQHPQQQHPQQQQQHKSYAPSQQQAPTPNPGFSSPRNNSTTGQQGSRPITTAAPSSTYYPSPFQNHIDQLGKLSQQEYDAQAEMIEDQDPSDQSTGPGPYPHAFHQQIQQSGLPQLDQQAHQQPQQPPISQAVDGNGPVFGAMNQLFDPFDPMLDADPFGLSASMHFPTQFSFETSSMR
ncbi:MAG: hypothetical protein M1835_002819 [Candelina submexicana]|nr:MAG: hypothetical protein M1835_002819 [Candelina submexicana]